MVFEEYNFNNALGGVMIYYKINIMYKPIYKNGDSWE